MDSFPNNSNSSNNTTTSSSSADGSNVALDKPGTPLPSTPVRHPLRFADKQDYVLVGIAQLKPSAMAALSRSSIDSLPI
ncbi:hypothetical protein H6P81_020749 [Aristolochia fimbriata]|uniref:Uncharacterized protein n=1 Tax=Aristolochia fimbriata TaxID=158543 RepID=A0AAV7DVL0_ARIFI|nr:hypothetical protein H6P81_020749 [Aristolochia fimbriata]